MKLKLFLDHTPVYQYITLTQNLKIVAEGKPDSKEIRAFEGYKVGLISVGECDNLMVSIS